MPRQPEAGDCDRDLDCQGGLYCDTSTKRCLAQKPIGAACQNASECLASCDINACWTPSCNNGICQPAICVDPTP